MKLLNYLSLLVLALVSCNERINNVEKNAKYTIVVSREGSVYGFHFKDKEDTLRLLEIINGSPTIFKILIDDETKQKIKEVINYHFQIVNFDSGKKKRSPTNSVTFEISSLSETDSYTGNVITSEWKGIIKNSDVSEEYDSLIKYLKSEYKEFDNW